MSSRHRENGAASREIVKETRLRLRGSSECGTTASAGAVVGQGEDFAPIYEELVRTAIHSVKSDHTRNPEISQAP
jgi:hypothetical protein